MNYPDYSPVKRYLLSTGIQLKTGCIMLGVFLLPCLYSFNTQTFLLGLCSAAIFTLIISAGSCTQALRVYKQSHADLLNTSSESEAARDFSGAQEAAGVGKVGKTYFFGRGTGVLLRFSDAASIVVLHEYQHDIPYDLCDDDDDDDSSVLSKVVDRAVHLAIYRGLEKLIAPNANVHTTLQFALHDGRQKLLCELNSPKQRQQAAAALKLIGNKCSLSEDAMQLRDHLDESTP